MPTGKCLNCFLISEEYHNNEYLVSCLDCYSVFVITMSAYQKFLAIGRIANEKTLERRVRELEKDLIEDENILNIIGSSPFRQSISERQERNLHLLVRYRLVLANR